MAALALAVTLGSSPAHADEVEDFVSAQNSYVNGDYTRASQELVALLSRGDSPALNVVRSSARRYLAASHFALHREAEARRVINELLLEDPEARLDRSQFEVGFVRVYDDVVRSLQPTLDRILSERALARQRAEADRISRQRAIEQFLNTEAQVEVVPRWQMFVPFGVGQFANHQSGLGALFLSLESIFAIGAATTAIVDQSLYSPTLPANQWAQDQEADQQRAALAATTRILNWTFLSALVATTIAGVIHANVTYVPTRVLERRARPVPPSLQGLQVSGLPGGGAASLTFSF